MSLHTKYSHTDENSCELLESALRKAMALSTERNCDALRSLVDDLQELKRQRDKSTTPKSTWESWYPVYLEFLKLLRDSFF